MIILQKDDSAACLNGGVAGTKSYKARKNYCDVFAIFLIINVCLRRDYVAVNNMGKFNQQKKLLTTFHGIFKSFKGNSYLQAFIDFY